MRFRLLPVLLLGILFVFHSAAVASIVSQTGSVTVIPAPSNVGPGALESDSQIVAFAEVQQLALPQALPVNISNPGTSPSAGRANLSPATIPAGTVVNSYLLHFDSISGTDIAPIGIAGSVTFSHDILGLIVHPATLSNTDSVVRLAGLTYPTGDNRGLELNSGDLAPDIINLSPDRRTVTLNLLNSVGVDQVRVITAVPEPSTWSLAVITSGALAIFQRRRRRGQF